MSSLSSDLTVGKISKLIRVIAIPAVVGTFFQTLYNIVDVKFAGMISPYALTGLAKVFPVYFVIIALSAGLSIGATALVSNYLGKKDFNRASLLFSQSIIVAIMSSVFVAIFGVYLAPIILKFLNTDANTFVFAIDYINVIFIGSIISQPKPITPRDPANCKNLFLQSSKGFLGSPSFFESSLLSKMCPIYC